MESPFEAKSEWYQPLIADSLGLLEDKYQIQDGDDDGTDDGGAVNINKQHHHDFCWGKYFSFFTIGLSMMWTWSMILQAVPYFKRRFEQNSWIQKYFQAFYLLFFAVTMLFTTLYLGLKPGQSRYVERLRCALTIYISVAALLMLSTIEVFTAQPSTYFVFTLVMITATAIANGLSQNAAFAFAAGFGRTEYAPALLTGEALAGLLPSTIEIISALAFPSAYFDSDHSESHSTSFLTLGYFFSAVLVGLSSMFALRFLASRNRDRNEFQPNEKLIPALSSWTRIERKLRCPATANFLCLCISSISPVFIAKITSVIPVEQASTLFRPQAFIPLAIVIWNIGDFTGSVLALSSSFLLRYPPLLVLLSLARLGFIPLYLLCNVDGRGSIFGDWFYLIAVQFSFGLTHGWLSGASMMGIPVWVADEDREEAGAFMGMTLVIGLFAGSILGLTVARV